MYYKLAFTTVSPTRNNLIKEAVTPLLTPEIQVRVFMV